MEAILNYLGLGGFAVLLLSIFVEISPIKINPIQWMGNTFNRGLKTSIDRTESKLDEHIAQSYRNKIMIFQRELLEGKNFSQEEFDECIDACDAYEEYVKQNKLKNGKATLAIEYIKSSYKLCQASGDFIDISSKSKEANEALKKEA